MSLIVKYTPVFEDLIGKKSAKYLTNRLFIVGTCCSDKKEDKYKQIAIRRKRESPNFTYLQRLF